MKNDIIVSVCIGTYNHQDFIKQCLDSVLQQKTNFEYEIILGEDESNDNTRQICKEYAKQYPDKIKLFLRSRKDVIYINGKATGRYNFIENLKECTGKYVALLDGDDYWTDPLKLQKQVDFLNANSDYNICYHKAILYKQDTNLFEKDVSIRKVSETSKIEDLAKGNYMHTATVVIRNNFILPKWFKNVAIGDWSLYMIVIQNKKVKFLNEEMAVYRVHNSSIWSSKTKRDKEIGTLKTIKTVLKNLPNIENVAKTILLYRIRAYNYNNYFTKRISIKVLNKLKAIFSVKKS